MQEIAIWRFQVVRRALWGLWVCASDRAVSFGVGCLPQGRVLSLLNGPDPVWQRTRIVFSIFLCDRYPTSDRAGSLPRRCGLCVFIMVLRYVLTAGLAVCIHAQRFR